MSEVAQSNRRGGLRDQATRLAQAAARLGLPPQPAEHDTTTANTKTAGDHRAKPVRGTRRARRNNQARRAAPNFFESQAARFEATLKAPAFQSVEEEEALQEAFQQHRRKSVLVSDGARLVDDEAQSTVPAVESISTRVARILEEKRLETRRERARKESAKWLEEQRRRRDYDEEEEMQARIPFSQKRKKKKQIRSFSAPALPPLLGRTEGRMKPRDALGSPPAPKSKTSPSSAALLQNTAKILQVRSTSFVRRLMLRLIETITHRPLRVGCVLLLHSFFFSPCLSLMMRLPTNNSMIAQSRGEKPNAQLQALPSRLQRRLHMALDFVHKVDQARKDLLIVDGADASQLEPLNVAAGPDGDSGGASGVVAELMARSPIRISPITSPASRRKRGEAPLPRFQTSTNSFKAAASQRIFDSQLLPSNRRAQAARLRRKKKQRHQPRRDFLHPMLQVDLERLSRMKKKKHKDRKKQASPRK